MSIANEIQRLQQAKADIAEAIVAKGGEVSGTLDTYAQAIEALPSGGGGEVVEGEVTLTSKNYYIPITHNKGKVAKLATIECITDQTTTWQILDAWIVDLGFAHVGGGIYKRDASTIETSLGRAVNNGDTWSPQSNENMVSFYVGNTSYRFVVGTYKYKIYFE